MGAAIDEREWWGVPVRKLKALVTFVRMAALVLTEASPVQPLPRTPMRTATADPGYSQGYYWVPTGVLWVPTGVHRGTHTKAYRYCGVYSLVPSQIDALRLD